MDNSPAFPIFLGLLIGAMFGLLIGTINGNAVHGMQLGAMAGLFIGWLVTTLALQK